MTAPTSPQLDALAPQELKAILLELGTRVATEDRNAGRQGVYSDRQSQSIKVGTRIYQFTIVTSAWLLDVPVRAQCTGRR